MPGKIRLPLSISLTWGSSTVNVPTLIIPGTCCITRFSRVLIYVFVCSFIYLFVCLYKRRFIIKIDYGRWEILQSAICELKKQEIQWYSSVRVWRPENQEPQCPRAADGCPSSRRENLPLLCLPVLYELTVDWMLPAHVGERDLLYSLYWFKCNLF